MNVVTKLVTGTVTALAFMAAQAQGLYGEIGYSGLNLNVAAPGSTSSNAGMVRGIVGYDINPHVAIEGVLGLVSGSGSPKVTQTAAVFVKPKLLGFGEDVVLFGRLGYAYTKITKDGEAINNGSALAYGLGVSYKINTITFVTLDQTTYRQKDGITVRDVAAGVGFNF